MATQYFKILHVHIYANYIHVLTIAVAVAKLSVHVLPIAVAVATFSVHVVTIQFQF